MQTTQYTHNGMIYREGFTGDADASHDNLLIVALHYMTGNAHAMHFLFDGFERPARLIFPQAKYALPDFGDDCYSWFPGEEAFYDLRTEAEQAPDIRTTSDQVADLIRHLRGESTAKVIITGMSQGGDLSLHLAAYYPELIDMAIPMAGRLSSVMRPETISAEKLPIVHIMTGADDPIVPVESVREVKAWLSEQGYVVTMKEYAGVKHDIPLEAVTDLHMILQSL